MDARVHFRDIKIDEVFRFPGQIQLWKKVEQTKAIFMPGTNEKIWISGNAIVIQTLKGIKS